MSPVAASPQHARAIDAVGRLLTTLRLDFMFAGNVARVAWLGGTIDSSSIDVVAIMQPQQKSQVAMMAANNGFRVDRDEVERAEELDLIPLRWNGVRVHVLVASNALYATMVRDAWNERFGENEWHVPSREDLALLLALGEEDDALRAVIALPEFDRAKYNARVASIGLAELAV